MQAGGKFYLALFLLAVASSQVAVAQAAGDVPNRYQISQVIPEHAASRPPIPQTILLDTVTGRTWRLVVSDTSILWMPINLANDLGGPRQSQPGNRP